ncbi:hypothetical protein CTA2_2560 [Colletotrichum tanaceti]|nr:hypothetical protein CTA2_2560 [Colletotrichum tanaceti]
MDAFTSYAPQILPSDELRDLRCDAEIRYYQSHVLDLGVCDASLEDFIEDYIENYYRLQAKPTRSSVSLTSDSSTTKPTSKLRRLLQRIIRKKL